MTATRSADVDAERYAREQAFHDERYADDPRAVVGKYYRVAETSRRRYADLLRITAGEVLEYGCGVGSAAVEGAGPETRVTGIDLSPTAVDLARRAAQAAGREVTFEVMNAEHLTFPDQSFDLVCGSGILHHLDLDLAYAEVARVLRPGGRAVFMEPLGHNPVINLYRRLTPALRSDDEHPLTRADLADADRWFAGVEIERFHLGVLALAPFDGDGPILSAVRRGVEAVDRGLLSLPGVRHLAWIAVLELTAPRLR